MTQIAKIGTNGYRGAPSNNEYIAPGEYRVGDEIEREIAEYMVSIDLAWIVDMSDTPDDEPGDLPFGSEAVEPDYLDSLNVQELRVLAQDHEIELPDRYVKKADLITLLLENA